MIIEDWKKITFDALPEFDTFVLVSKPDGRIIRSSAEDIRNEFATTITNKNHQLAYVYWMPIPPLPTENRKFLRVFHRVDQSRSGMNDIYVDKDEITYRKDTLGNMVAANIAYSVITEEVYNGVWNEGGVYEL
jgi:hypothetical protein